MDSTLIPDELDVADVLLHLPQLFIVKPEAKPQRGYFGILPRWGLRKPRSVPSDKPPDPSPALESKEPIPEPTPPAPPAASSPSTPMSFPATSEETEPKLFIPKNPSSSQSLKIHEQWIQEQNENIAWLSAMGANLQRKLEVSRGNHVSTEARNSWLKEISLLLKQRARKRRKVTIEEPVNPMNSSELARVDGHHPINGGDNANNRDRKGDLVCLPDLNVSAEDVDRWERAVAAAQARKRRREICRQKGVSHATAVAVAGSGALPPRPRLRYKVASLTC